MPPEGPALPPALPPAVAAGVERLVVDRLSERRLAEITAGLSAAYREGSGSTRPLVGADEVAAYCAYRLPATYAAVRAALVALRAASPAFAPRTVLDLGGGPGAGSLAAASCFGSVESATVVDANPEMLRAGEELAAAGGFPRSTTWRRASLGRGATPDVAGDLVVVSYLLGELDESAREDLVERCAASPASAVVVVEPGTPAGFGRVLQARSTLLAAGWTVAAPCPHDAGCPVSQPDWCHFSVRVPRSHLHRVAKGGTLAYEDEKHSYVVALRTPAEKRPAGRIVRHPTWRRSVAALRICGVPPGLGSLAVAKSAGAEYRAARRARWGDPWPPAC